MTFPSLDLQGNILSAEVLDQIARGEADGQKPAAFGLTADTTVDRAVGEAWAAARTYWKTFADKRAKLKEGDTGVTLTRRNWMTLLLGELGYELEQPAEVEVLNDKPYPVSHRATNRGGLPVHIMGVNDGLDQRRASGQPRLSPHALLQEYLNHSEHAYGLVTNGLQLRLLRDSVRLGRPAYVEFDLERILDEELYPDFAALYRALHASRMPTGMDAVEEALIEKYHVQGIESGTRIREQLEGAVKNAIETLANGLFANNPALADAAVQGKVEPAAYYHVLLRTVYRMLFLIVIEERDLVHPAPQGEADPVGHLRDIYRRYYSFGRLRKLALRAAYVDGHKRDLWRSVLSTFALFERAGKGAALGIAPLGSELFGTPLAIAAHDLHDLELDNHRVLEILKGLLLTKNAQGTLVPVNYAGLNVEEFGSVYEGLLDLEPVIGTATGKPAFSFKQGDERSNTGSHYTPDELVQPLIKHSLDHLIADKLKERDKEKALLSLRVADISCGSGHILLAAARRIATELAIVRTGMEQPRAADFRVAMRDVIRHCIYGVDLNPLAVELCKVALWLEAHVPGEPLNFLDHRIKCGNAIVGYATKAEVDKGVPDEAFAKLPGDEPEVVKTYRDANKRERAQRTQLQTVENPEVEQHLQQVLTELRAVDGLPEHTPAEVEAKKQRFQRAMDRHAYQLNQLAAIPIAQFYTPKTTAHKEHLITDAGFRGYWVQGQPLQGPAAEHASTTAKRKRFFHWFIEFPEVFANGGFDCILGNPPFLGGNKIATKLGEGTFNFLLYDYYPTRGRSDLVAYFIRRAYQLLRPNGFGAFIATNTISQGDTREGGLGTIIGLGGCIVFAVRSMKWPGRAAVQVSLIALEKDGSRPGILDGRVVPTINAYLDEAGMDTNAPPLAENGEPGFLGSNLYGEGFVLELDEAKRLLSEDIRNQDVVFPYLTGKDLNKSPVQAAARAVINFFDWDYAKASSYTRCMAILTEKVKPIRDPVVARGKQVHEVDYWKFWDKRLEKYKLLEPLSRVLAITRVSRTMAFAFVNPKQVFGDSVVLMPVERASYFSILQSSLHHYWVWKYCTTMKTDPNYGPSNVLQNFPIPYAHEDSEALEQIGERYHEHRRQLMCHCWRGLTDVYNLFHSQPLGTATAEELALPDAAFEKLLGKEAKALRKHLQNPKAPADVEVWPFNRVVEGVLRLRQLHVELDNAVRDAYGWQDLDLQHAFYDVDTLPENDRTRYTISPAARKEVLKRLLALNHERAAEEAKAGPVKKGKKEKAPKAPRVEDKQQLGFFGESSVELEGIEEASSTKRGLGRPPKAAGDGSSAAEAILAYLQGHPGLHGKSAILAATGIDEGHWNAAIKQLVEEGKVKKEGEKKGARYGV